MHVYVERYQFVFYSFNACYYSSDTNAYTIIFIYTAQTTTFSFIKKKLLIVKDATYCLADIDCSLVDLNPLLFLRIIVFIASLLCIVFLALFINFLSG